MKRVLLLLLSMAAATAAHAQIYIDETSNYGNMTQRAGTSPYNYVDEFWLPASTTDIYVNGQDGRGACSGRGCTSPLYRTGITQPYLMTAALDPNGGPQIDVAPAVDVNGVQVQFIYAPRTVSYVQYDGWYLEAQLPEGTYNLHLTGTSCGGRNCTLPGASLLFVQTSITLTNPPPPPPPCTDECTPD